MKIVACYNIKGGVGKTSTVVNLAYLAARDGARVLVCDLDPQGAASFYFRIKPKIKGGVSRILNKKADLDDYIKGTDFANLDLLPADFSFRHLDILLDESSNPQLKLAKMLKPLKRDYDVIFLDCAPSISKVSESVFNAADILLIPTIPTILSLRTLKKIIQYQKKNAIKNLLLMPFFSMADRRKKMHSQIIQHPPEFGVSILESTIPYASEVERMGLERKPLHSYAASSAAADAYKKLWNEIDLFSPDNKA